MLLLCWQKIKMLCCNINLWRLHICGAYQRVTQRKNWHILLYIAFFISLPQEERIGWTKKENVCLEVHILPQSLVMQSLISNVWTTCKICLLCQPISNTQHWHFKPSMATEPMTTMLDSVMKSQTLKHHTKIIHRTQSDTVDSLPEVFHNSLLLWH